jgi:RNA-directed DNA polymerase
VNTGAPWPSLDEAEARVLGIQTKLHRWATDDPKRRFDDLYNLVHDPAVLLVAWRRVRANRGARSAGVDGETARSIEAGRGVQALLSGLREELKTRRFAPRPVRERLIPKRGGKVRRLGIAIVADRVVQAALKLVLEPIFEADFQPCSYGFRPERRAQDAIAEVHFFASHSYEWVLEGDITACFDEISHSALLGRVRDRIGDKRVLALVKAFLKAGILSEDGAERDTITGTPQGGILSPLLSNIALSALDEHFARAWEAMGPSRARERRRRKGLANYRLVRYADDLSSWWPAPARMPRACARRSQRSWPRRACACRRPRRGSSTSTRALSSWGSVSSGIPGEARRDATSTPTRPRPPWRPSRRRCGRRLDKARTNRSLPC